MGVKKVVIKWREMKCVGKIRFFKGSIVVKEVNFGNVDKDSILDFC